MQTLAIALGAGVLYLVAYHTYGKWLARKIFKLNPDAVVPSVELNDDADYVPTKKSIVFGHHFTSIAGTGPIVGPAIAVMWGWLPALIWVLLGSILIGAVHDFGALVVSLRNRGQTVGDIAGRVLNKRVRLLFLCVLFMALTIVLAIFGLVIAAVFRQYPASIFPCLVQIPIAVAIGVWLHRKGVNILIPSIIALSVMYLTVVFGDWGPLHAINEWFASWPTIVWVGVLLVYSYVASVLPVWSLLQPRDYINSLQLITALALVVVGLGAAAMFGGAPPVEGAARPALEVAAPMIRANPEGAPLIIPFLFITIACGACSGFHCLVSSGTSSKQLKNESDATFVGYGSMLTEGFLATLVILACVAGLGLGITPERLPNPGGSPQSRFDGHMTWKGPDGELRYANPTSSGISQVLPGVGDDTRELTHIDGSGKETATLYSVEAGDATFMARDGIWISRGTDRGDASENAFDASIIGTAAYNTRYASWDGAKGLGAKVGAFVDGSANFLKALGLPAGVAIALMGVLVASFAGTTLDTACRLQRYVVQELASTFAPGRPDANTSKHAATDPVSSGSSMNPIVWLTNKHGATIFAIVIAGIIAAMPNPGAALTMESSGKGGLILWPLFGATNQLLAGLAFLVITFYLWRRKAPIWMTAVPMIFMLIMPAWAMLVELPNWIGADQPNYVVIVIAIATIALEAWMICEAIALWPKARGVIEESLPPLGAQAGTEPTGEGGRSC